MHGQQQRLTTSCQPQAHAGSSACLSNATTQPGHLHLAAGHVALSSPCWDTPFPQNCRPQLLCSCSVPKTVLMATGLCCSLLSLKLDPPSFTHTTQCTHPTKLGSAITTRIGVATIEQGSARAAKCLPGAPQQRDSAHGAAGCSCTACGHCLRWHRRCWQVSLQAAEPASLRTPRPACM